MNIIELKDSIIKKQLKNFYVFVGEEIGIINIYLNQISKVLGLPITRVDSVLDIMETLSTPSMFGPSNNLYAIRGDDDFIKQDKVFSTFERTIGKNTVILIYTKLDSRLKFSKHFEDNIVKFEPLAHSVLCNYIKKEIDLSDAYVEELSNKVNGSYDLAMLEIDKLRHSSITDKNKAFRQFVDNGVIGDLEETDVFKFTDAVCRRDKKESIRIAQTLTSNGVSSINILGTLYNSMKTVLLIQVCENNDIAGTTGLDNRQIYFNKKYAHKKYQSGELVNAVRFIARTVEDIKNGLVDDRNATMYALLHII